ncbi:EAL domain-containing protein [Asanoa sp. WMMD1127]|uniref:EAL domain-containing protein n=1 Tax=Asanoa sp. WMMD1127 TaxID=3016107 RepID=UPI0024159E83|nr:EAL domain-containing protein [Asanoa sp. WMMD1127]MDG4824941.1 EAL domain-containing protein [Asanoa sp. WMMD1127]
MANEARYPDDVGFDAVLAGRLVEPVFQPVVALADRRPVGFEALARGPEGRFHEATALFAAAARAGRSAELDWLCADQALRRFGEAGFPGLALFVNLNPDTLATDAPEELVEAYEQLRQERDVVLEITERSVMGQPARLLDAVLDARRRTARIALDDIGTEPASLAAMPLINPDIIKLDRSIIQSRSEAWEVSRVVNAVLDEAQRRGAQILAEGIERPEHVAVARSLGATLGQGWLFGRPGPLPSAVDPSPEPLARVERYHPRVSDTTPFDVLAETAQVAPTPTDLYASMAAHVENQAAQTANPAILAVNLGDDGLGDAARMRYSYLTNRGIDVFLFGTRVSPTPGGRIRGVTLDHDDVLARERTVLFAGTRYGSGAFGRRPTHDRGDDSLDAGTCYDAECVIEAMLALVGRLPAMSTDTAPS